ncbi:TetR/AcrR family transcriptional regulator [Paenibacillus melissococcoides]|uniref:TetR/AcrR family transcriptional regulator n=2 Tax=Paenibacillus TaxID=44249 RepID=A0ABN8U0L3_9BACL|nr:TetR/AcrR family transcriptional regulator [Paenibacillus melissococcoides]CAH8244181.1 TetR/AcrR family transcriptional regulator [Paenibacillus melissococcoides]CAH8703707.1 TetR/AcrR family transcriptional regulator [Paenibacillus melissococcoides]CAH8706215.1 TetR/AcrR family transcriptional regulator [Paenibacillus melissococcoides]
MFVVKGGIRMSMLKEKIVQSAIRLFTEKGYQATSIQDIADDCSIAKGSLYKHFASKEDLYIHILELRQQNMMDAVEKIKQKGLSKRETFLEEIACQFEFFIEHGYYISRDHNELPPANNDKIGAVIKQLRINMFRYYQDILVRQYGAIVEGWKWDITALFNGMIREYTFHLLFGHKPLAQKDLALFIAGRMDDLIIGFERHSPAPLLTDELMKEYADAQFEPENGIQETRRSALFHTILSIIPDMSVPNARKKDLSEVAAMLRDELEKDQPRGFLVQALLRDLAAERELGFYVNQLQPLMPNTSG